MHAKNFELYQQVVFSHRYKVQVECFIYIHSTRSRYSQITFILSFLLSLDLGDLTSSVSLIIATSSRVMVNGPQILCSNVQRTCNNCTRGYYDLNFLTRSFFLPIQSKEFHILFFSTCTKNWCKHNKLLSVENGFRRTNNKVAWVHTGWYAPNMNLFVPTLKMDKGN